MINGETIGGKTSGAASPDRFDEFSRRVVDQKPQVTNPSPDSSDYESDFERYCSANSVMGTPSVCGSVGTAFNDFLDLDFVPVSSSSGSLKVGEDEKVARRNSGGGSVFRSEEAFDLFNGGAEFQDEDAANGDFMGDRKLWPRTSPLPHRAICSENSDCSSVASEDGNGLEASQSSNVNNSSHFTSYNDNVGEDLTGSAVPEASDVSPVSAGKCISQVLGANGELHDHFDPFNDKENEGPEEEETSYRYELSDDDDDSMFNYGTYDERKMDSYNLRNNLHYLQDTKKDIENALLMGSAVGFGSEDWESFMQETENSVDSLSLKNKPMDKQQENPKKEGKLVNSIYEDHVSASNDDASEQKEIMRNVPSTTCLADYREDSESCSTRNRLAAEDFIAAKTSLKDKEAESEHLFRSREKVVGAHTGNTSKNEILVKSKQSEVFPGVKVVQLGSSAPAEPCGEEAVSFEDNKVQKSPQAIEIRFDVGVNAKEKPSSSENLIKPHLAPIKVGNFELKESYDDLVLEMEEILLDSAETHRSRLPQNNRSPLPFRDGSSTASTSGTNDIFSSPQEPLKVDGVEVVGAKQKKGDVSLGERLVGVKEYTVYLLRVWSGNDHWEVERRYRDFFTLYRQLKTLYASHGCSLPTPWSHVEQESRKFFGNASPSVVSERSGLIQDCLRSILHSDTPNGALSTLNWFLSPQKAISSPSLLNTLVHQSTSAFTGGTPTGDVPTFGKTISLLVEIQPRKSVKQLLESQHYLCAGCHKQFDAEKNLMRGFVHTLGWGKPRLCEYTGQLFCASCHTNETAVLPARVLHFWDFTEYPVSQMAKSYLDSIYDQPMLCVSAVNPFLFSKVPVLFHVMGFRKKIGAMMPYVRCPFRMSIHRAVGSRRYLIENNEFFALRDLVDLSKGAFSALPVLMETASTKILNHITQQCLICCDVGVPCGARQVCEDPSSLIFPFQEDEVKRCRSCESVFHKACFTKLSICPCSVDLGVGNSARPVREVNQEPNNCNVASDALARKPDSGSPIKFLSYLFKSRQEKALKRKTSNPVILMGSLPSTFTNPL